MYECTLVISTSIGLVILALSRREPNCTRSLQISACPSSYFKSWKFQFNNWTSPFTLRPLGSNLRDVRFEFLTDHIPSLKRLPFLSSNSGIPGPFLSGSFQTIISPISLSSTPYWRRRNVNLKKYTSVFWSCKKITWRTHRRPWRSLLQSNPAEWNGSIPELSGTTIKHFTAQTRKWS